MVLTPLPAFASAGPVASVAAPTAPVVAPTYAAQVAVNTAMAQLGKPYIWGAAGPGAFDCSGLTEYAYRAAGISLPHSSAHAVADRHPRVDREPAARRPGVLLHAARATSASTSATASGARADHR